MRPTDELLRVAIARSGFVVEQQQLDPSGHFDICDVRLPMPDFKGFPPNWTFAVLNRGSSAADGIRQDALLDDAERILLTLDHRRLLVFISDDASTNLHNRFGQSPRSVFCLDHVDLPARIDERVPRNAPFVIAVRQKLPANAPALPYSPYQRKKPVEEWRFFGREDELKELANSDENIIIIGGRRIGKTSLMLEASRRLKKKGDNAYYVSVMELKTKDQVTREILARLSPRDAVAAVRQSELLYENVLASALKRLSRAHRRTTLLLDEINNVFDQKPFDEWNYFGAFRHYTQSGSLRVIVSCFSEDFYRQLVDYAGPFINFGRTIRLKVLPEPEVRDLLLSPLEFLRPMAGNERDRLVALVQSVVGGHPLLLQYFCHALSETIIGSRKTHSLIDNAEWILTDKASLVRCFCDPVEEIFYRLKWATLQYVFLRRCHESGDRPSEAIVDDDWLASTLLDCGFKATVNDRRNILDNLEMHGLCSPVDFDRRRQRVSASIIYHYVKSTEQSIERLLDKYRHDLGAEAVVWGLTPASDGSRGAVRG